jgi:hypothetical protein
MPDVIWRAVGRERLRANYLRGLVYHSEIDETATPYERQLNVYNV